jgi:hypothetical protein
MMFMWCILFQIPTIDWRIFTEWWRFTRYDVYVMRFPETYDRMTDFSWMEVYSIWCLCDEVSPRPTIDWRNLWVEVHSIWCWCDEVSQIPTIDWRISSFNEANIYGISELMLKLLSNIHILTLFIFHNF